MDGYKELKLKQRIRSLMRRHVCYKSGCSRLVNGEPKPCIYISNNEEDLCDLAYYIKEGPEKQEGSND